MTLNELFKNTTYDDTLFSAEAKSVIESRIFMKPVPFHSAAPYAEQRLWNETDETVCKNGSRFPQVSEAAPM